MTAHRWLFAGAASVPLERTRLKPPQDPSSSRWRHPRPCPPSPRQPPARCSRSARCPTTGAPARSPSRAASRRAKPLTHRVLSHRRDITPAQAPRDGSAHSCGSAPGAVAKFPRIWAGNAAATGWWRPRQRGSATPRTVIARQTFDLYPSYSPQILPYPGLPGTASGEPRQVSSISDKFIPPDTPIFGRPEAQDGAWDRPGVDSPRRCGVSARPWSVQGCA